MPATSCGAASGEPAKGIDALRLYWEQTLEHDNVAAMDHAVRAAPGCPDLRSMEDLFHDFVVTNYVKNMGNVSERYRYADEQGPEGTRYDDVHLEAHEAIAPGRPLPRTGTCRPRRSSAGTTKSRRRLNSSRRRSYSVIDSGSKHASAACCASVEAQM